MELSKKNLESNNNPSDSFRKTLIICLYPPSKRLGASGAAIIFRRIFRDYPSSKLCVLTSRIALKLSKDQPDALLSCQHVEIMTIPLKRLIYRLKHFNIFLIPLIALKAIRIIRKHQMHTIFSVPHSGEFFIAAYFASRVTRRPLYVYVLDDLVSQRPSSLGHLCAKLMFKRIFCYAEKRWVISTYMAEEFKRRYGVSSIPLPRSVALGMFNSKMIETDDSKQADDTTWNIVYTGSIYSVQLDAMLNLVRLLNDKDRVPLPNVSLTLYCHSNRERLARMGIQGDRIQRLYVDVELIPEVLQKAHILFLPLSFKAEQRGIVSTSLPTKFSEYLASGVPILVHAPPYATVTRFSKEYDCALVVDEADLEKLLAGVKILLMDREARARLSRHAKFVAKEFFDARKNITEDFLGEFRINEGTIF